MKVLIVGHGLAGASVAYRLYKQNINFTVVEGRQFSASRVAAGMVNPIVFRRLNRSWALEECLPVMNDFYKEIEAELNLKFYYNLAIDKLLSEGEFRFWHQKMDDDKLLLPYIERPKLMGDSYSCLKQFYGTGSVQQSGYVDLNVLLDGIINKWKVMNCYDSLEFAHKELKKVNDGYFWNNKEYTHVVFSEGIGVMQNPYFSWVAMKPVKGELLTIYSEGLEQKKIINKNMFILPVGNHLFKVGATYNWDDLTDVPTEKGFTELIDKLESIIAVPYKVLEKHAGVRPTVKDRRPIIGRHRELKNLTIFNGLGAKGVMLAPYFSDLFVNHLINPEIMIPEEVNVNRFL